jgi:hypothetical protein
MQATLYNKEEFVKDYVEHCGGTFLNAFRVWQVECLENLKDDLSKPFPSQETLRKYGVIE